MVIQEGVKYSIYYMIIKNDEDKLACFCGEDCKEQVEIEGGNIIFEDFNYEALSLSGNGTCITEGQFPNFYYIL